MKITTIHYERITTTALDSYTLAQTNNMIYKQDCKILYKI